MLLGNKIRWDTSIGEPPAGSSISVLEKVRATWYVFLLLFGWVVI